MTPLSNHKPYKDFVRQKNQVLEYILEDTLSKVDDILRAFLEQVVILVTHVHHLKTHTSNPPAMLTKLVDDGMLSDLYHAAEDAIKQYEKARIVSFALSYAGEVEGISRATGKAEAFLSREEIKKVLAKDSVYGGKVASRVVMHFNALRRKILNQVEIGLVSDETLPELVKRVRDCFPKQVLKSKRKLKLVKPIKEAEAPKKPVVAGIFDDQTWNEVVDAYKSANIPTKRGPDDKRVIAGDRGKKIDVYDWEIEKEITEEFVSQVRQGQVKAAKDNGITDFIWIAVIDNRTCEECCRWRDGLTVTEIKSQLRGKHKGDKCQGTAPPLHPNCRCDLAPITDKIKDTELEDIGDFETWLTT